MHDDGYFDERVAAKYDEPGPETAAEAVEPRENAADDARSGGPSGA